MREDEIRKLILHIKDKFDLNLVALEPATYWASLPICLIDSVWSIRSKYDKQVVPLIDRFCRLHNWDANNRLNPPDDHGPKLTDLIRVIDQHLQKNLSYQSLFQNSQRTSTRSGILKAEAVHRFAKALVASGIDQASDLRDHSKLRNAEQLVRTIPGQGSGLTFTYFLMLAGENNFVKSDVHIRRFVSDALSVDWRNLISMTQAANLVTEAAVTLSRDFPGLTPAKLDHAIWAYQKGRTKPDARDSSKPKAASGCLH